MHDSSTTWIDVRETDINAQTLKPLCNAQVHRATGSSPFRLLLSLHSFWTFLFWQSYDFTDWRNNNKITARNECDTTTSYSRIAAMCQDLEKQMNSLQRLCKDDRDPKTCNVPLFFCRTVHLHRRPPMPTSATERLATVSYNKMMPTQTGPFKVV